MPTTTVPALEALELAAAEAACVEDGACEVVTTMDGTEEVEVCV